jgi:CsoR family transcriptional regulator, copper-sensing transcriptional repressor
LVILTHTPSPLGGGSEKEKQMQNPEALARLKTVEGHIRGIEHMLEDGVYCIDVIRQIQAVQAALNKVSSQILENHLNSCLITAVRGDDPSERERVLGEIAEVFTAASKI